MVTQQWLDPEDDDAAFKAEEKARISALQKSAPEVIWLQVDPEAEQFDGWEAQTWCSDKINETDVKYIRADLMPNPKSAAEIWRVKEGAQRD